MSDFWVFGYGSLIWKPGFEFMAESKAMLEGWNRCLCVYSWVHRGTEELPGLVLGLDRGGNCEGLARLVSGEKRDRVIAYLRERELVTNVYQEVWVDITLQGGERVKALTYVVDRNHQQYASKHTVGELVEMIRRSKGQSGTNSDYVCSTYASLRELDINDEVLEKIVSELKSDIISRG